MTASETGTRRTRRWNSTRSAPVTARLNSGATLPVVARTTSSSSSSGGCLITMWNMNRSSWASGNGYVPSSSMGFLGGEHEEGLVERVGATLHGDAMLLHRLKQRRLRLGRCPVDFVREQHVGEDGTGREDHLPPTALRIFLDDVGASDVGWHEVRRELDPGELQVEHLRHRLDEQGLGQAGHADDEAVAADEERQQGFIDDLLLPDDLLCAARRESARVPAFMRSARAISSGLFRSVGCSANESTIPLSLPAARSIRTGYLRGGCPTHFSVARRGLNAHGSISTHSMCHRVHDVVHAKFE